MADPQSLVFSIQVIDEANLGPDLDAAVRRLLCECFPADVAAFSTHRAWNDVHPAFSVLGWQGDNMVGHVGIIERRITCGGVPVGIAGIQSMAVASVWRKSGLSQRLMTAAMQEAQRRGTRFGLLFCLPRLEDFYGLLGWQRIERAVAMRDAAGRTVPLTAKNICMELALAGEPLPPGPIDLEGRDW